MIELTDRDFRNLCADDRVRRIIADADRRGRRAAFGFWAILVVGLAMIGGATAWLIGEGWLVTGVAIGSVGVLAVYILAALPLAMAGRAIKLPVFDILAGRHGLVYEPLVHSPPVFAEARPFLFGEEPVSESFTDFFHGTLLDASEFATCQGYVLGENGGRFNGRLFSFARPRGGDGAVVVTSDRPRWVDPATSLATGEDPAFGRAFRVHATIAEEGRALLGPAARCALLELRRLGKVRLYAGPGAILVALDGRKGFTPGLGFRFRGGEARVRAMFDDLADSLALLRRLKTALDPAP
jgi:hypothetical protein